MNQVYAGAAGLILALVLWGFGKKPQDTLNSKTNQKVLKDLNRQQLDLLVKERDARANRLATAAPCPVAPPSNNTQSDIFFLQN